MAWAQELIDFVLKLKPWTTVDEYQTGLYLVLGKVMECRIPERKLIESLDRKKVSQRADRVKIDDKVRALGIDEIRKLESDVNELYRGLKKKDRNITALPQQYHDWHLRRGKLEHPGRYSKNIPYGIYFHFPEALDINRVVTMPAREVVKDLKFISTLVKLDSNLSYKNADFTVGDNKRAGPKTFSLRDMPGIELYAQLGYIPLFISGFIKYEIEDGYKAFTGVQDWERSYHSKALMTISEYVRETMLSDWTKKNFVDGIESKVKDSLNGTVREKWGIWTSEVGITDAVPHGLVRNVQELYVPDEGLKVNLFGS
jgi:hypothetical protein